MLSGIGSTIAQGMAFGTGSAVGKTPSFFSAEVVVRIGHISLTLNPLCAFCDVQPTVQLVL